MYRVEFHLADAGRGGARTWAGTQPGRLIRPGRADVPIPARPPSNRPQLEVFAAEGADLACAMTLDTCAEAIGITTAAHDREHQPGEPAQWADRVLGVRYNASERSHAELDEAADLDRGDPDELAADHARLAPLMPRLVVLGGCCGTDASHVRRLWQTARP